jgi:superfamily I DNA/RNA helicase
VPDADPAELMRLDLLMSRLKVEAGATLEAVQADPEPGRLGSIFVTYERTLRDEGAVDFDDLVLGAIDALETDAELRSTWRERCAELLVDEVQDVDRGQLELALLLAAPAHRIFLVGDDDQTIYGWRLADVRRVLSLAERLPGLRRVALETNFRCPGVVVERAVRLVEQNRERFAKVIRSRREAPGAIRLVADDRDEPVRVAAVVAALAEDGTSAVLSRTNRELLPAIAACLELGRAFRAARGPELLADPAVDGIIASARATTNPDLPLLVRLAAARPVATTRATTEPGRTGQGPDAGDPDATTDPAAAHAALLAWAARFDTLDALADAISATRTRLEELWRDDAPLTLATAHGTKGLEWDEVAVIGMDADRFPSARSVSTAVEPARALEEERRLAYVAWTRARRVLTLLYDPAAPSRFLLEAFSDAELGPDAGGRRMAS